MVCNDPSRRSKLLCCPIGGQSEPSGIRSFNVTIWGNHSATQYPDYYNAKIGGIAAPEVIADDTWAHVDFIPTVQQRGAAIIQAARCIIGPHQQPTLRLIQLSLSPHPHRKATGIAYVLHLTVATALRRG